MQLLGPNHPDVAKQFNNLAILSSHLGKYEEVGVGHVIIMCWSCDSTMDVGGVLLSAGP